MNDYKIAKVVKLIKKSGIELDYVSPNFVADIAYNHKIELTNNEVVFISDHIETLITE
jgi:hypothetical protein